MNINPKVIDAYYGAGTVRRNHPHNGPISGRRFIDRCHDATEVHPRAAYDSHVPIRPHRIGDRLRLLRPALCRFTTRDR